MRHYWLIHCNKCTIPKPDINNHRDYVRGEAGERENMGTLYFLHNFPLNLKHCCKQIVYFKKKKQSMYKS